MDWRYTGIRKLRHKSKLLQFGVSLSRGSLY